MKKILFTSLTLVLILASCTKETIEIQQPSNKIVVDFGYSVVYNPDSTSVTITAADASNNLPSSAIPSFTCNNDWRSNARWEYSTYDVSGFMSITERVDVNGTIYSAMHSFTIYKRKQ